MISLLFKKEYNPILWAPKPVVERSPGVPLPKAPSQQTAVRKAPVIGVLGVKGGVGATTIAVNLAFAMSKRFGSATLIDANLQQPDTALMLGRESNYSLIDLMQRQELSREVFDACCIDASDLGA